MPLVWTIGYWSLVIRRRRHRHEQAETAVGELASQRGHSASWLGRFPQVSGQVVGQTVQTRWIDPPQDAAHQRE